MRTTIYLATALALASTAASAGIDFSYPTDNLFTITSSTRISAICRTCLIPSIHKSSPSCSKETNPPTVASATAAEHLKCWNSIGKNGGSSPFQTCIVPKNCTLAEASEVLLYYLRQVETTRAEITASNAGPMGMKFANPVDNLYTISDAVLSTGCKTCIYPLYQKASPDCAKESNPPSVNSATPAEHLKCWEFLGKNETVYQPCVAQTQCKAGEVTAFQGYVARQAATAKALIEANPAYATSGAVADAFAATSTGTATGTAGTSKPTILGSGANGLIASGKVVAFGAFVALAAAGLVF
ncbi:hypothetical protein EC957_002892 [Mortierella hygrophila]|uniref:Uncharacterized protein n=1 Tax=Mortierella hygrophila TaxID=979708 RepID=A0A9P6K1G7_9FUNG|nr:hypothetical protein EC957_002892 [Mortierella hygrophila]